MNVYVIIGDLSAFYNIFMSYKNGKLIIVETGKFIINYVQPMQRCFKLVKYVTCRTDLFYFLVRYMVLIKSGLSF